MSNEKINKVLIKAESVENFFARGRETAKLLDQNKTVKPRRIISFEDPRDLIKFLTAAKINLLSTIRKHPDSLSNLAKLLNRSRAAINKDIQLLEAIGIVKSEYVANPGHGKQKIISAIDKEPIQLQVQTVI